ncbi:DUF3137 domain-containing protein [Haloplasma contractile]|uniref:Galanin protein n=1 Tax=Haloplasma contractile SSD-17B TaxID=1033810 RepID=U2EC27_9MOLU|nr:DUF3137 domain-containing protein [Haloplasma contractile]ERJ12346.1 galanin protein [Haloplasma contractile SSD-17B]
MNYDQIINELELKRKSVLKAIMISALVTLGVVLISLLFGDVTYTVGAFIVAVIVSVIICEPKSKAYKNQFKNEFMPMMLKEFDEGINYNYKEGLSESITNSSKLFKRPDRYKTEDLLYGKIDGVDFKCADVNMEEKHVRRDKDGKTHTSYTTIFHGRWFIFEFNKEFNGLIQVREGGSPNLPWFGSEYKVKRTKLEDIEFNKRFNTFSSDQHEAFYVLTPSLMERMKELERANPGHIYFSFIKNQLHVALYNNKDTFEPPLFKPFDRQIIEEQMRDLELIKDIVHELKLNIKIFKKD